MKVNEDLIWKRNVLMLKILWGFYITDIIVNIIVDGDLSAIYPPVGMMICAILSLLVWRRKWAAFTMYVMICAIYVFFFILIIANPYLVNFIFLGLAPLLTLLYHDYRAIVLAGTLYISLLLYFFFAFHEQIFPGVDTMDAVYLVLFGFFITVFLYLYTRFTKGLELRAERSAEQLKHILSSVSIVSWSNEVSSKEMLVSAGIEQMTGFTVEEFKDDYQRWINIVHDEDLDTALQAQRDLFLGKHSIIEYRIVCRDGSIRWVQNRGIPISDASDQIVRIEGVLIDITERKSLEEVIEHMAYHDHLTGLPNRVLFDKYYSQHVNSGKLAVMFIDLDDFKTINDTHGHEAGNLLLRGVSKRLRKRIKTNGILSRYGGDEFIAILTGIDKERATIVSKEMIVDFSEPFVIQNYTLTVTPSIGISTLSSRKESVDDMIKKADTAMYLAKKEGKNKYRFFEDGY